MNHKNFVFSSVGDNTDFENYWISNNMEYDIYVMYYGDNDEIFDRYKSKVKYCERRKGSKFQNFKFFYDNNPDIINKYTHFFILDDDIIINVSEINGMFKIAKEYNLDICGPSFIHPSKISHWVTQHKPYKVLTYTNFVEVNVPLFNKKALLNLMKWLHEELIGWGIDCLYIWANGLDKTNSYAIIHSISCINPPEKLKKIQKDNRELFNLPKAKYRSQIWETFAAEINCPKIIFSKEYKSIIQLSFLV